MKLVDILCLATSGIIVLVFIIGIIYTRRNEKKKWNKGRCPICGKPWIHFDTDSQGGRMYRCENWHGCEVTYKIDK